MLGQNLLSVVKKYAYPFCDWCDVLNSRIAAVIIAMCCLIVTGKQVFGDVIRCIPVNHASISSSIVSYAEVSCWANYTVHIPLEDHFNDSQHYKIAYYQWAHYFLAAQAFAFFLPSLIWYLMAESSFPFASTVRKCNEDEIATDLEKRQKLIKTICHSLHSYFGRHKKVYKINDNEISKMSGFNHVSCYIKEIFPSFAPRGCTLIWCYLVIKILFLLNLAAQFYLTQSFIGARFSHFYGFNWVMKYLCNTTWESNLLPFPLQTLCVVPVKTHKVEHKLFQCFLTLNLLYNKMFSYISALLAFTTVATLCNFVCWIIWTVMWPARCCYVRSLLIGHRHQMVFVAAKHPNGFPCRSRLSEDPVQVFVHNYLRQDGVLIIKLLTSATNAFFGYEVCNALFRLFLSVHERTAGGCTQNNDIELDSTYFHVANEDFGKACKSVMDKKNALNGEVVSDEKICYGELNRWFEHSWSNEGISPLEHHNTSGTTENIPMCR